MPRIINAYSNGADSIAGSLKSLGESMFDNQAQKELVRQNALKVGRQNEFIPQAADALSRGDVAGAIAAGVRGGISATDASGYNLLGASDRAHGNIDDPNLATAQLGAREPISSTAVGQGRSLANARNIAQMTTDRAAATQESIAQRQIQQQQWTDEHTLVNLMGPDGRVKMVPKSQAADLQVHGYQVVPSQTQIEMQMLGVTPQGAVPPAAPQPAAAPATPQPDQPAAPVPFTDPAGAPAATEAPPPPAPPLPPPPGPQQQSEMLNGPKTTEGHPLSPLLEQTVDAIGQYKRAPLVQSSRAAGLAGMQTQMIMNRVQEKYPDYHPQKYLASVDAEKKFGAGRQGDIVRSFDVGISHLGTLHSLADGLENGDIKMVNAARNAWREQTGQEAPTNFAAARSIVAAEVVKAIVGSQGALGDREEALRQINAANSPAQLRGVINTWKSLMAGQLKGLKRQYMANGGQNFDRKLDPLTVQELLTAQEPQQAAGAPDAEGWTTLPNGMRIREKR